MNNTINILSGAVTFPVFDLLHDHMNLREIWRFYHSLCDLKGVHHINAAVAIIDVLIRFAEIEPPDVYAEVMASRRHQAIFLDEFLADFEDILSEYEA